MIDIKEFRKENNLRQSDIAAYLGTSKSFISQIEAGKRPLPATMLSMLLNNDRGWSTSMLRSVVSMPVEADVPALSGDVLAYLREKDEEIRSMRLRIDELTRELHEKELEIVELKKENLLVAKSADAAASSQKVG